jgi:hypothetical protein
MRRNGATLVLLLTAFQAGMLGAPARAADGGAAAAEPPVPGKGTHGSCGIPNAMPDPPLAIYSNVTYVTHTVSGTAVPVQLDVRVPTNVSAPPPVIVTVHGGGYYTGDKVDQEPPSQTYRHGKGDTAYWNALGFATVSVNYRLDATPTGSFYTPIAAGEFPGALQDFRCAIRWIRHNAQTYGLNGKYIGAYGVSAGGGLVAAAGTIPDSKPEQGNLHLFDSPDCVDENGGLLQEKSAIQFAATLFGNNMYTDTIADDPMLPQSLQFDSDWSYQVIQSTQTVGDAIGEVWGSLYNTYGNAQPFLPAGDAKNPNWDPPAPYTLTQPTGSGPQTGPATQATAHLLTLPSSFLTPGITAPAATAEGEFDENLKTFGQDYVDHRPAFFIVNGTADDIVPTMQSPSLAALLQTYGVNVFGTVGLTTNVPNPNTQTQPLQPVYGLGHGFEIFTFTPAWQKKFGQNVDVINANGAACEMIEIAQCTLMGQSPLGTCPSGLVRE